MAPMVVGGDAIARRDHSLCADEVSSVAVHLTREEALNALLVCTTWKKGVYRSKCAELTYHYSTHEKSNVALAFESAPSPSPFARHISHVAFHHDEHQMYTHLEAAVYPSPPPPPPDIGAFTLFASKIANLRTFSVYDNYTEAMPLESMRTLCMFAAHSSTITSFKFTDVYQDRPGVVYILAYVVATNRSLASLDIRKVSSTTAEWAPSSRRSARARA
jgi:hypothetical protein